MRPAKYWRWNKDWKKWLGKKGVVISATTIRVGTDQQRDYLPYSFVLVDFGSKKASFPGVSSQVIKPGQKVKCVFRKMANHDEEGVIFYGIKVLPI